MCASAAVLLVATGCSGGGDDDETSPTDDGFVAVSTTVPAQDPCRHTSVGEVTAVFGGSVSIAVDEGRCRFTLAPGEDALLDVRPTGTIASLVEAEPVSEDLGGPAAWGATPSGGTLAVEVGDRLALFEVVVGGRSDEAQALALGWARTVVPRLAEDDEEVPAPPVIEGCELLTDDARAELLEDFEPVEGPDPTVCTWSSPEGAQVIVGPVVRPATLAQLEQTMRTSGTDEWPRQVVHVGDGGVLLTDPDGSGTTYLTVLDGVELLQVGVLDADGDDAAALAAEVAEAVIDRR